MFEDVEQIRKLRKKYNAEMARSGIATFTELARYSPGGYSTYHHERPNRALVQRQRVRCNWPDETEVWSNNSGFPVTKEQNNAYNIQIASIAHYFELSVGLKGNTTEASELWQYFDWSLNEQCWEFEECDNLKESFLANGKAVFNIEYNRTPDCSKANAWHMNSARRDL